MVDRHEADPHDGNIQGNNFQVQVKLKRLSLDFINEQIGGSKKKKATKKNSSIKNILTICLECGYYSKVYPVPSGFEIHSCSEKNLNNFTESMQMIKARAVNLIDSHGLPLGSAHQTSLRPTIPPPPSMLPIPALPGSPGSSPHITLTYIDELKKVLQ